MDKEDGIDIYMYVCVYIYIYIYIYGISFSHKKKCEIFPFEARRMVLEVIIIKQNKSERKKQISHDFTFM